jgi:hypothetical protein
VCEAGGRNLRQAIVSHQFQRTAAARSTPGPHPLPKSDVRYLARRRDWDALRRAYETPDADLEALAVASAIQPRTLHYYAVDKGWQRVVTPPIAPVPAAALAVQQAIAGCAKCGRAAMAQRITPAAIRALKWRLFRAIERKLEQLEMSMHDDTPQSKVEHERDTRMLGQLTRNMEKLNDRDGAGDDGAGGRAGTKRRPKSDAAPDGSGHDAELIRRELAARIQRLRERPHQ